MSWNQRKAERRAERTAESNRQYEAHMREEARKACLPMWERIEEADASPSVKEILHMLAEKLGMEGLAGT